MTNEFCIIKVAKEIATIAHSGQVRRGTHEPYIVHPEAVAKAVELKGGTQEQIAAAWLHDVIEDSNYTAQDLLDAGLPVSVVDIVVELTDIYTKEAFPGKNRKERKKLEAERISKISDEAKLVKLCDIADNDKTIELLGGQFAKLWRSEKAELLEVLKK